MNTPTIVLLALAPLVLWRIYARVRRMVGRQRLSRVRPWVPVCLFPILVVLLALASLQHPPAFASLAGGLVIGSLLAVYGLRLTRFERTAQGLFYTPNAYLGSALAIFGTLAGYYVAYAIGLLRWRRRAPIT